MDKICPLCNALQTINQICPICGQPMIDGGVIENYFGPYSPYMDQELFESPDRFCTHLLYCPECHHDVRISLEMVNI
ncbi:hypothetical protein HA075_19425 [bacterium BFN5]|nr:hypothetical protein HA075_19385 [bacterium BFN5]QJW47739.1 hypothetical protein HA075_19425 [bacterium BFN5]